MGTAEVRRSGDGPDGEYLHLGFRCLRDWTVVLRPGFHTRSTPPPVTLGSDSALSCELRGAEGEPLVFHRCRAIDVHAARGGPCREYYEVMPWANEAKFLVFLHGKAEVDTFEIEEEAPEFTMPPEADVRGERVSLRWVARHPTRPVHHLVRLSTDGGRSWQAVAWMDAAREEPEDGAGSHVAQGEFLADLKALAAGSVCHFQVLATSGLRTAAAVTRQLELPMRSRRAYIVHPPAGAEFPAGETVVLCGTGFSATYGSAQDEEISWSSDRDGFLGWSNAQDLWINLGLAREGRTFPNDPVMVIE